MISRRNIRVKVMQLLYMTETAGGGLFKDPVKELQSQLDAVRQLFAYMIYFVTEVARFAEADSKQKASKHLPTHGDLNVNIKIAGNELLWQILENPSFKHAVETDKFELMIDKDLVKKIYLELINSEEYKTYINEQSRDKKNEKAMLEFIFNNLLLQSESFESHAEEHFNNWQDDAEMLQQLVNAFLQKPSQDIQQMLPDDKWQFAKTLLTTVEDKKELALDLIKPKLKNWDADRIAVLDMLLMRMGVCELLYFETIPPKVTINEYIDLAKDYSTPQSGHFVNGILDNINKELAAEGKLNKVDFKKKKVF
jgi:N utilization substance protein B